MEQEEKYIHHHLIERAKAFDRKAQAELYRNYSKAMYHTSLRIVANQFLAEDIIHDAFIDAFRKISSLKENHQFGPWLKRLVINKSINQINRDKRLEASLEELENYSDEPVESEPDLTIEEVKQAMNKLAKQYRLICSLYLFEGYDHNEIGEILEISPSASRSHFSRARKKLILEIEKLKTQQYEIG